MMQKSRRLRGVVAWAAVSCAAVAAAPPGRAGSGAGEIALDANAVTALVAANLPAPTKFAIPGLGSLEIRISAPRQVTFDQGALAATFPVSVQPGRLAGSVAVRVVPQLDPVSGQLTLRVLSAKADGALSALGDAAEWLPPIELPRQLEWVNEGPAGAKTQMTVMVQTVELQGERLVFKLGLGTRPAAPTAPRR